MKIIIAHYRYSVQGGPERYMLKFMELAKKNGHTIIPFSVNYDNNLESAYSEYFVTPTDKENTGRFDASTLSLSGFIRTIWHQFHNREAYNKLSQLIDNEKPDILYVLIPGMLTGDIIRAAKDKNIPVILRLSDFRLICGVNVLLRDGCICEQCIHGNYRCMVKNRCVKNSKMMSILRCMSLMNDRKRNTYSLVDAVITPPRFTADKFIESGYFPADKIYVNPTFLDATNVIPNYTHKNYVLCLGRFSPEKGFIYVVEALKYLKDLPVKVAVTGDKDSCDATMKSLIEQHELEDKIIFVGFVHGEQLEKITAEAMCVACPAIWYENLPNTVIEAYAYGKPVIASNLGSLAEIVENRKTGLLFEPKNSKQIADCIRELYENPQFTRTLGMNARRKCEMDFSPEKHWKKFDDICSEIRRKK